VKLWPGQPDNWKPTTKDKGRFWLGLLICFFVLAGYAHFYPTTDFLGRWGWLHRIFSSQFGTLGDVILNGAVGAIALLVGLSYLSTKEQ
jgi:hypothetical protein